MATCIGVQDTLLNALTEGVNLRLVTWKVRLEEGCEDVRHYRLKGAQKKESREA